MYRLNERYSLLACIVRPLNNNGFSDYINSLDIRMISKGDVGQISHSAMLEIVMYMIRRKWSKHEILLDKYRHLG